MLLLAGSLTFVGEVVHQVTLLVSRLKNDGQLPLPLMEVCTGEVYLELSISDKG